MLGSLWEILFCPAHGLLAPVNLAGFLMYARQVPAGVLFLVHKVNKGKYADN